MNVHTILVVVIVFSSVACGGRSEPEEDNVRDSKPGPGSRQLQGDNKLPPEIKIETAASITSGKSNRRRNNIESLSSSSQLLLAIPRDNIVPTKTRVDGLLERSLSLDVETVLVGTNPGPVVRADEIVAPLQVFEFAGTEPVRLPRQEFIARDGKARVVAIETCVEKDGRKRRVVYHAYVPSPSKLAELTEDVSKYNPKATSQPLACERGTSPLVERWTQTLHLED